MEPRNPRSAKDRLVAAARRESALGGKFSIGSADQPGFMDSLTAKRHAWARSSLGANKKLSIGKSYSVLSMEREKLAPVVTLTKKRSILRSKPNVMEVAPELEEDAKSFSTDEENPSVGCVGWPVGRSVIFVISSSPGRI